MHVAGIAPQCVHRHSKVAGGLMSARCWHCSTVRAQALQGGGGFNECTLLALIGRVSAQAHRRWRLKSTKTTGEHVGRAFYITHTHTHTHLHHETTLECVKGYVGGTRSPWEQISLQIYKLTDQQISLNQVAAAR